MIERDGDEIKFGACNRNIFTIPTADTNGNPPRGYQHHVEMSMVHLDDITVEWEGGVANKALKIYSQLSILKLQQVLFLPIAHLSYEHIQSLFLHLAVLNRMLREFGQVH
jgi:hypothetical protein